jgi:hypothetical protein
VLVFSIPAILIHSAEAEEKYAGLRDIFWAQAGYRGVRVLGAFSIFMPIVFATSEIEFNTDSIPFVFLGVFLFYEHLKLYRSAEIFDTKVSIAFTALIFLNVVISFLSSLGHVHVFFVFLFGFVSGISWGWFVNLKRSKQIFHTAFFKVVVTISFFLCGLFTPLLRPIWI